MQPTVHPVGWCSSNGHKLFCTSRVLLIGHPLWSVGCFYLERQSMYTADALLAPHTYTQPQRRVANNVQSENADLIIINSRNTSNSISRFSALTAPVRINWPIFMIMNQSHFATQAIWDEELKIYEIVKLSFIFVTPVLQYTKFSILEAKIVFKYTYSFQLQKNHLIFSRSLTLKYGYRPICFKFH